MPRLIVLLCLLCLATPGVARASAPAAGSPAERSPAARFAEAITYRTISYQDRSRIDYGEFNQLLALLRAAYPRVFSELQVEAVNDYSLLIHWRGSDPAADDVLFIAHTDVVPVEPGTEGDWTHPPFDGVMADGRIYGRGTLDDKIGVMSLLEAAEGLLAEGFAPRGDIVLAFGHDEEIGGRQGAAALAQRMRERGMQFRWMVDEGGFIAADNPLLSDRPVAGVAVAEKGYLTLTLVVTGTGGHSSMPPARSTIGRLAEALHKIESNPFPPRLVAPVRAMLGRMAPHVGGVQGLVLGNLWLTDWLVASQMSNDRMTNSLVRTTTALTMFNAGIKENVVPQRAEAKVNFRLLPGDTPDDVVQAVRDIIADPAIEVSYERWQNVPPVSDHEGPGFLAIEQAVLAVYPDALVTPGLMMATTDTRHYIELARDQYRFHGMLVRISQAASVHGTDEYVEVASYLKTIEVARQMMRRGAGGD
jgi:carboxypeptidase PM20D1